MRKLRAAGPAVAGLAVALMAAVGCAAPARLTPPAAARADEAGLSAPLPVDPNVKIITLDNGMECWMRAHQTPPDRVGIWLDVNTGSINEEDDERGLAHFLEHLAFDGSENFPPGELVKYFESIGLTFGHHQNASTGFQQTTYTLTLPDTEDATVRKGLLCMADYAFRLSLLPEEVDKERRVVLEECRARKGARQRVFEKLLPILLPGSRAAQRLPIGKEETIAVLTREQFVGYYRARYRPDNATLLIVGDMEPDAMAQMVREAFADWPVPPDPPPNADPGVKPYAETRAAVVTDPELTTADVSVVSVRPLEKLRTVGDFRRELVDGLAQWIMNRRLVELIQKGEAPFQRASVVKFQLWNVCTYAEAEATGQPDQWEPMLAGLLTEMKRARLHGFLEQELDDARKAAIAAAEQDARTEATWDAETFLSYMDLCVAEERRPMAEAQKLELVRELIGGVTPAEAAASFRRNFDESARLLLITMPEKEGLAVPAEDALLAVARTAERADVGALAAKERPDSLLEREPTPGAVIEQEEDADLGILSVTLGNGVRAHLRSMDFKKNEAFVSVTLAGGAIRETAQNRAVTSVAALAFRQPAGGKLSSTDVRDLLTGKNVSFSAGASEDAIALEITGAPDDLEEGFRLAHLLLTQPTVEASALKVWKEQMAQEIERRKTSVEANLREESHALLTDGDPRLRFPTAEQVDRLTLEEGQQWLDELVRTAPIELAVVGDVERGRMLDLVLTYFGSLPERPRVTDDPFAALREVRQRPGEPEAVVEVETITPRAVVMTGWRGADWRDVKDRRLLQIAAQILSTRLRVEIREERGLTYSPWCDARAARAYPGAGLIAAYFSADPDKAAEAAEVARDVMRSFATEGPTGEEMAAVRKQFANIIETSQKEPTYWARVLGELDYRGTVIEDVKHALEAYTSYTREDMMDVLARYVAPERRIQVIAVPVSPAAAAE